MHGQDILCGIPKGIFEIPHKLACPYIERCDFLYNIENLQTFRFKSSYAFFKQTLKRTQII